MDYVLFGMGYGASLMLLGWALRTFGPQRRYSRAPQEEDARFLVERRSWVRFIQGLGGIVAIAGTTMVLLTFVVVLVNPADDTGVTIAMVIWALILIIVLAWCILYLARFGFTGIWSRGERHSLRQSKASPRPLSAQDAVPGVEPQKLSHEEVEAPVEEAASNTEAGVPTIETIEPEPDAAAETDGAGLEFVDADVPNGPVYDFGDGSDTTVPSDIGGRAEALRRLRERQARSRETSS